MKFTASKKDLIKALERASSVADKRSSMPILSNVHLRVDGASVIVTAMDLFVSVRSSVPVTDTASGQVCTDARGLLDRVRAIPGESVTIALKKDALHISGGKGVARKFTLYSIPGEDYPTAPTAEPNSATDHVIKTTTLNAMLAATLHAALVDDSRLALNSVLIELTPTSAAAVTTDGHRLAKHSADHDGPTLLGLLVPLRGASLIKRDCDASEDVVIRVNGPTAFFDFGSFTTSIKTVDAQFPPYEQVIPTSCESTVGVTRGELSESIKAVCVAADKSNENVNLTFSKGSITITAEASGQGDGEDRISCDYQGKPVTVAVCARYLVSALAAEPDELAALGIGGELDPIMIGNGASVQVVMPVRQ